MWAVAVCEQAVAAGTSGSGVCGQWQYVSRQWRLVPVVLEYVGTSHQHSYSVHLID